jgi:hypothetical protein
MKIAEEYKIRLPKVKSNRLWYLSLPADVAYYQVYTDTLYLERKIGEKNSNEIFEFYYYIR